MHVQVSSANVGVRGNAAMNKPVTLVPQDPGIEKIETNWPTGGRFLWTMSPYPPVESPQDSNLPPWNSTPGGCPL